MQRQSLLTDHFVLSWWPPESPKLHPQQEGAPVEHTSTQQYVEIELSNRCPMFFIVRYLKPWLFVFEAHPTFVDPWLCWNSSSNQHRLTFGDPWLCWNSSSNQHRLTFVDPWLCWNSSSNQHLLTFVDPWLCWNSSSNQSHLCTSPIVLEFFKQPMSSEV
jgi:hypothetical protein